MSTTRRCEEILANEAIRATRKARTKKHNDDKSLEGWIGGGGGDVSRGGGARPKKMRNKGGKGEAKEKRNEGVRPKKRMAKEVDRGEPID